MPTTTIILALVVLMAGRSLVSADCLSDCLTNATSPCTSSSFPQMMSCITTTCPVLSTTGPLTNLSTLQVSYTPKVTYQCENSPVSEANTESPTMLLNGTGNCETSPFDFKSLVAGPRTNDEAVDQDCKIAVFPAEQCGGEASMIGLVDGAEECHFVGGRSARLVCDAAVDHVLLASNILDLCSNISSSTITEPSGSATAYSPLYTTGPHGTGEPTIGSGNITMAGTLSTSTLAFNATKTGAGYSFAPTTAVTATSAHASSKSSITTPPVPPYTGSAAVPNAWSLRDLVTAAAMGLLCGWIIN